MQTFPIQHNIYMSMYMQKTCRTLINWILDDASQYIWLICNYKLITCMLLTAYVIA